MSLVSIFSLSTSQFGPLAFTLFPLFFPHPNLIAILQAIRGMQVYYLNFTLSNAGMPEEKETGWGKPQRVRTAMRRRRQPKHAGNETDGQEILKNFPTIVWKISSCVCRFIKVRRFNGQSWVRCRKPIMYLVYIRSPPITAQLSSTSVSETLSSFIICIIFT